MKNLRGMNKNIDYWEDEEEEREEKSELSAMELTEMIEERLEKGSHTDASRKETNDLIDEYVRRFGHGYKRI